MKNENHFEIKDGKVFSDTHFVCVLPYVLDENGVIISIGVDENDNSLKAPIEKSDSSIIFSAKKLLSDYDFEENILADSTRWKFLGSVKLSEEVNVKHFLWAFNAKEANNEKVKMSNISLALDTTSEIKESILITSFFMLFMQIYRKEFQNNG